MTNEVIARQTNECFKLISNSFYLVLFFFLNVRHHPKFKFEGERKEAYL